MSQLGQNPVTLTFPEGVKPNRMFWASPRSIWRSRRSLLRRDNSVAWRRSFVDGVGADPARSVSFADLLSAQRLAGGFRFLVLGDAGEGDQSQYALVPVIRALAPDWIVIDGDVAYPAGSRDDFLRGFFRPYRDLGIPIWAVPGNHEYYSKDKGRTFFDTFCTYREKQRWDRHGLALVPQPGTFWEVREPAPAQGPSPPTRRLLTVLALDTGMKGNLDGVGRGKGPDEEQIGWLRDRLRRADEETLPDGSPARAVIVLFHIPALVDERDDEDVHLTGLHAALSASPSVRMVVCGHIHNHQAYSPAEFGRFLARRAKGAAPLDPPHYVVSGGGGAYLSRPDRHGDFPADFMFPSLDDWRRYAGRAQKMAAGAGLGRTAVGRVAGLFSSSLRSDDDSGRFLSLLMIDVTPRSVEARHILMPDLTELYPRGTQVDVATGRPPIEAGALAGLQHATVMKIC